MKKQDENQVEDCMVEEYEVGHQGGWLSKLFYHSDDAY